MSRQTHIHCNVCKKEAYVRHGTGQPAPRTCDECINKAAETAETKYLNTLAKLPVEERLARIEKWIYNYRPPHRNTMLDVIG